MLNKKQNKGFTLTEVLISAGILSIGFMLIAGAFPVGVKLTSLATERTIGSVTAQEAIAKIKLYGIDPNWLPTGQCVDYETIAGPGFMPFEQYYPSTNLVDQPEKKYHWSALCRDTGISNQFQVTVFVSRLAGVGVQYPYPLPINPANITDVPKPILITNPVVPLLTANSLDISSMPGYTTYFREGSVIVDDRNGNTYTVQERTNDGNTIVLDRDWLPDNAVDYEIWIIPSAIKSGTSAPYTLGGRWPCVWVFQDTIKFK